MIWAADTNALGDLVGFFALFSPPNLDCTPPVDPTKMTCNCHSLDLNKAHSPDPYCSRALVRVSRFACSASARGMRHAELSDPVRTHRHGHRHPHCLFLVDDSVRTVVGTRADDAVDRYAVMRFWPDTLRIDGECQRKRKRQKGKWREAKG